MTSDSQKPLFFIYWMKILGFLFKFSWSLLTKDPAGNKSPDSKVHGANMGPTWILSAPDGPHVGPVNLAIRVNIGWGNGLLPKRREVSSWSSVDQYYKRPMVSLDYKELNLKQIPISHRMYHSHLKWKTQQRLHYFLSKYIKINCPRRR